MADELVFSTTGGQSKGKSKNQAKNRSKNPSKHQAKKIGISEGPCKMRLETRGRGGKKVTVVFNLPFDGTEAKKRMKEIQGKLSCGATYKNEMIEFRGDVREQLKEIFSANGEKIIAAGG